MNKKIKTAAVDHLLDAILCLKDKDVNALKQIVDFAKQFAGI